MYFDEFICRFSADEIISEIPADRILKNKFHYRPGSKCAYILCPPWGQKLLYFAPLRWRILKQGYSCMEYEISRSVLTADLARISRYIAFLSEQIQKDVNSLKKKGFSSFVVIGTSIGTSLALILAKKIPEVKKVILNTPGNCYAEIIWSSVRLKVLKKRLVDQGMSLDYLKEIWRDFSPETDLKMLAGKEIFINLSRSDLVVPYKTGLKLVEKIKLAGLKPVVEENTSLGHYFTAARYYLKPNFL